MSAGSMPLSQQHPNTTRPSPSTAIAGSKGKGDSFADLTDLKAELVRKPPMGKSPQRPRNQPKMTRSSSQDDAAAMIHQLNLNVRRNSQPTVQSGRPARSRAPEHREASRERVIGRFAVVDNPEESDDDFHPHVAGATGPLNATVAPAHSTAQPAAAGPSSSSRPPAPVSTPVSAPTSSMAPSQPSAPASSSSASSSSSSSSSTSVAAAPSPSSSTAAAAAAPAAVASTVTTAGNKPIKKPVANGGSHGVPERVSPDPPAAPVGGNGHAKVVGRFVVEDIDRDEEEEEEQDIATHQLTAPNADATATRRNRSSGDSPVVSTAWATPETGTTEIATNTHQSGRYEVSDIIEAPVAYLDPLAAAEQSSSSATSNAAALPGITMSAAAVQGIASISGVGAEHRKGDMRTESSAAASVVSPRTAVAASHSVGSSPVRVAPRTNGQHTSSESRGVSAVASSSSSSSSAATVPPSRAVSVQPAQTTAGSPSPLLGTSSSSVGPRHERSGSHSSHSGMPPRVRPSSSRRHSSRRPDNSSPVSTSRLDNRLDTRRAFSGGTRYGPTPGLPEQLRLADASPMQLLMAFQERFDAMIADNKRLQVHNKRLQVHVKRLRKENKELRCELETMRSDLDTNAAPYRRSRPSSHRSQHFTSSDSDTGLHAGSGQAGSSATASSSSAGLHRRAPSPRDVGVNLLANMPKPHPRGVGSSSGAGGRTPGSASRGVGGGGGGASSSAGGGKRVGAGGASSSSASGTGGRGGTGGGGGGDGGDGGGGADAGAESKTARAVPSSSANGNQSNGPRQGSGRGVTKVTVVPAPSPQVASALPTAAPLLANSTSHSSSGTSDAVRNGPPPE